MRAADAPRAHLELDFRAFYSQHLRLVLTSLKRMGVRDADLMDLTQKVFLTAHLRLSAFEGRSRLSTWLVGICRHTALAYRRSMAFRSEISTDPATLEFFRERGGGSEPEADLIKHAAAERIITKLSEAQRLVFTLYEIDELSASEIAALLRIPLGTVRSRLRYARALFRREVRRLSCTTAFDCSLRR